VEVENLLSLKVMFSSYEVEIDGEERYIGGLIATLYS